MLCLGSLLKLLPDCQAGGLSSDTTKLWACLHSSGACIKLLLSQCQLLAARLSILCTASTERCLACQAASLCAQRSKLQRTAAWEC